MYQDITNVLIFDDAEQVAYVVGIQTVRRVYRGKEEIERAKEYIGMTATTAPMTA